MSTRKVNLVVEGLRERVKAIKAAKKTGKKLTGFLDAGEVIIHAEGGERIDDFDSYELQEVVCILLGIESERV